MNKNHPLKTLLTLVVAIAAFAVLFDAPAHGETVFVEAESFEKQGGWKLDTQFIEIMGSPYLLAHGLGSPVEDATTTVTFDTPGEYRVFVRTKDWVARWNAPGEPGRFQLLVDGKPLEETFGTEGADWHWQPGGSVNITGREVELSLHDLTGFDGRCDAVLFTLDKSFTPPNGNEPFASWRKHLLGIPDEPETTEQFDLVVVGGGYSGCGSAVSAARMGCKVALIQNRPLLGGNSSSEVRVWPKGNTRRGLFPRIGEIIEEMSPQPEPTTSPGPAEEFQDALKEKTVRAEENITLLLNHHAYQVELDEGRILSVTAFDTRTGRHTRFAGKLFVDCTGHGTLGYLAKAEHETTPTGHMGMSNMWMWKDTDGPQAYPKTPWALELSMDDFPYPQKFHGQWFWETGFDKDPIHDLEYMRDWNLRAVFGAFNAMKNGDGAADHETAMLTWVAYIGGPRESRRLMGDVVLTQDDVINLVAFPDGCVPTTWSIDLHYPCEEYVREKYADDPFISIAVHDRRVDRATGYPVPYRCFYSRNVPNLFMAGRCVSVTHEALGTVRVMKTCGMMGEVVGKAASICIERSCSPREVYEKYLDNLKDLMNLPGVARRQTVRDPIEIVGPVPEIPSTSIARASIDPKSLPGVVIDNRFADTEGRWSSGSGLDGYVGWEYVYAPRDSDSTIRFGIEVAEAGMYEVRISYRHHKNRATNAPVEVRHADGRSEFTVNMQKAGPLDNEFLSLGTFRFTPDKRGAVVISAKGADGTVCADAMQLLPKH